MNKLSKNILEKIKKEKILPKGKWIFQAKNVAFWVGGILAVLLLGIFAGNVIYDVMVGEWDIAHRYPQGGIRFITQTVSILWLIGLIAMGLLACFFFRKTKKGYKLTVLALTSVILIASISSGFALLTTPIPPKFHEIRMEHFPPPFEEEEWNNPSEGLLIGKIVEVGDKILLLNSIDDLEWEVGISNAKVPPDLELETEMVVRVIGKKLEEGKFEAEFIKPEIPFEMMREEIMRGENHQEEEVYQKE